MAGWVVKLNGTVVKKIANVVVREDLGKPMKFFAATMRHPSDSERTTLEAARGHLIGSHRIQIYRKNVEKFDGFLEAADPVGLDFVLQGRSHEVLLFDERTSQDIEFTNKTGEQIIRNSVNDSGIVPTYSTKITEFDITYPETIAGTMRYNHENLLQGTARVCNINSKDFWVTRTTTPAFKLHTGTRGFGSVGSPVATYTVGKEIKITYGKKNVRDLINRIRVFGSGDGINQIQVCVPWIDVNLPDSDRRGGFDGYDAGDDCTHTVATASQSSVGIMEGKPHVDRAIMSKANAIEIAKTILDERAQLYQNLKVDFMKYVDLNLGDWIGIVDTKAGLNVSTRIKSLTHRYNMGGQDIIEVEVYNPFSSTEDRINIQERDSDTVNISGQGATNVMQIQSYENCDAGHPLNVRFRLPDDVVQVNKVLLSFNLADYRAYHTANAGESAHTHSLGLWNESSSYETFLLGVEDRGGGNVVFVGAPGIASASVSDSGSSHTHSVTFGINEITLTDPSVVVTAGIDGSETAVDTYTTDQTDIDIVSNIGAMVNWMSVIFTPNKPMRIEANIYVKCYIESK